MHNGLSIYQTNCCEWEYVSCLTTHSLRNIQSSSSGQTNCYARFRNKPTLITELQLNLQKHIKI